jgi:hypothetical protein
MRYLTLLLLYEHTEPTELWYSRLSRNSQAVIQTVYVRLDLCRYLVCFMLDSSASQGQVRIG